MIRIKKCFLGICAKFKNDGNLFIDMAMKVGIVVVVAAAILGILEVAIPGLFTDLITKIETVLAI